MSSFKNVKYIIFLLLTLPRYFFVLMYFGCHKIFRAFKIYYFTKERNWGPESYGLCDVLYQIRSRAKRKAVWFSSPVLFPLGHMGAELCGSAGAEGPGHSRLSSGTHYTTAPQPLCFPGNWTSLGRAEFIITLNCKKPTVHFLWYSFSFGELWFKFCCFKRWMLVPGSLLVWIVRTWAVIIVTEPF